MKSRTLSSFVFFCNVSIGNFKEKTSNSCVPFLTSSEPSSLCTNTQQPAISAATLLRQVGNIRDASAALDPFICRCCWQARSLPHLARRFKLLQYPVEWLPVFGVQVHFSQLGVNNFADKPRRKQNSPPSIHSSPNLTNCGRVKTANLVKRKIHLSNPTKLGRVP